MLAVHHVHYTCMHHSEKVNFILYIYYIVIPIEGSDGDNSKYERDIPLSFNFPLNYYTVLVIIIR